MHKDENPHGDFRHSYIQGFNLVTPLNDYGSLSCLKNPFFYSFLSLKGFVVMVERWLPAAPSLMQYINPNFFQIVPVNVPQNNSYLPQSFMPLSMTIPWKSEQKTLIGLNSMLTTEAGDKASPN